MDAIVPLNAAITPDVHIPESISTASAITPAHPEPLPERDQLEPSVECQTYIWTRPLNTLDKELWSFEEFIRINAWKWVGSTSKDSEEYSEVEKRRQMQGEIVRDT